MRNRPEKRRRSAVGGGQCRQSAGNARLDGEARFERHVPEFLELAEAESGRVSKVKEEGTGSSCSDICGSCFFLFSFSEGFDERNEENQRTTG